MLARLDPPSEMTDARLTVERKGDTPIGTGRAIGNDPAARDSNSCATGCALCTTEKKGVEMARLSAGRGGPAPAGTPMERGGNW